MTDKHLQKLKRIELLELLVEQGEQMEKLQKELDKVKKELAQRKLMCRQVGSLAEAALKLNDIFSAADQAAKDYLENVKLMTEQASKANEQTSKASENNENKEC